MVEKVDERWVNDAIAHASRRARRELVRVCVYERGGVLFVRAQYEPQPDGSRLIARVNSAGFVISGPADHADPWSREYTNRPTPPGV